MSNYSSRNTKNSDIDVQYFQRYNTLLFYSCQWRPCIRFYVCLTRNIQFLDFDVASCSMTSWSMSSERCHRALYRGCQGVFLLGLLTGFSLLASAAIFHRNHKSHLQVFILLFSLIRPLNVNYIGSKLIISIVIRQHFPPKIRYI